jgi:ornithine decarboxylase
MLLTESALLIDEEAPKRSNFDSRTEAFLSLSRPQTPVLVMDLNKVVAKYHDLCRAMPKAAIYYAVKANPLPDVLDRLAQTDSRFDVASVEEIRLCLSSGIAADRLSFGNTIKKPEAITFAHRVGVKLFSVDCASEIRKVAAHAPGAQICLRLLTSGTGAEWPLSRKFGCEPEMAAELLELAHSLGLVAYGLCFHVGSQQTDPTQWDTPIATAAQIFSQMRMRGIILELLNLGGGFPATYRSNVPALTEYAAAIALSLDQHFGLAQPRIAIEPGRCLVAEAGVIETEVVLISRKSHDGPRWVYVDCGKFGGLVETLDETIEYPMYAVGRSSLMAPAILAGPTCDSVDILYEKADYRFPVDLEEGDRIRIHSAGAYTHSYASIGFNGFSPLHAICI